jgi:hypothetical protein
MCYKSPWGRGREKRRPSTSPQGHGDGLSVSSRAVTILARRPTSGATGPQLKIVFLFRVSPPEPAYPVLNPVQYCSRRAFQTAQTVDARALEIERVRKAEEARKAAEEAERAAREAEQREREAVEDADQGICGVDLGAATQDADAAFAAFRKADHVAARAERDSHIRIAGGFGKAMGLRDRETLTVTDWQAAITELGLTDLIRDAILTSARAYRKNFRELPEGIVATYDRSL